IVYSQLAAGSVIDLGADDDVLNLEWNGLVAGLLDGGSGNDRLNLSWITLDLTDTSQVANFESFYLSGGTYGIDQALIDSGMIVGGGSAVLNTSETSLDLSGWQFGPNFFFGTTNSEGTSFTVTDLATGLNVRGGAGNDSLLAQGFSFTEIQLVQLLDSGIETVIDQNGTHGMNTDLFV
ncbi:hypothetical protein JI739_22130, partial [Ramlibacter sp. AW1]